MKKITQKQLCIEFRQDYKGKYSSYFAIRNLNVQEREEKLLYHREKQTYEMFNFSFNLIDYYISEFPTELLYSNKKAHILP